MSEKFPIPVVSENVDNDKPTEDTELVASDKDKHVLMAEAFKEQLAKTKRKPLQRNLTEVPIHHATRQSKIALALVPMWGPQVAPYGIARLAGIARHSGFETKCWDVNIDCYAKFPEFWTYLHDWKWHNDEVYFSEIYPTIEPVLDQFVNELVEFKPNLIGFTGYYTNNKTLRLVIKKIKKVLPNAIIALGGPNARQLIEYNDPDTEQFDYIVHGEGEMQFIDLIEGLENNNLPKEKVLYHNKDIRIDLDSLPIPDYRDFDIHKYEFAGIAGEISRGCVAKCTFCSETTFWRYRGRVAGNVLDEVEYNYKAFDIKTYWFIDSLVNGNLKELGKFAQGLLDKNIQIKWGGFCRNDGRMDKQYLKTLLDSGLSTLMIGIESGSQKVIDLIDKKVKVAEIEQNFKDLAELGSYWSGSSWFVGFPGELPADVAQTLTLIWRLRKGGLQNKGFGVCHVIFDAPLGMRKEEFGIHPHLGIFGNTWVTTDWKNTIAHRILRYKFIYVLQNHYRMHGIDEPTIAGYRGEQTGFLDHYTLTYNPDNWIDDIPYEPDFDYDIIKTDINPVADSLVNEIWALVRVLWQAMGQFELKLKFDPEIDYPVYGDFKYFGQGTGGLWANYEFKIDNDGNWTANYYTKMEASHDYLNDPEVNYDYDFEHNWLGSGKWTRGPEPVKKLATNNKRDI